MGIGRPHTGIIGAAANGISIPGSGNSQECTASSAVISLQCCVQALDAAGMALGGLIAGPVTNHAILLPLRRRQGRPNRIGSASSFVRSFADALCMGSSAPVLMRVGNDA